MADDEHCIEIKGRRWRRSDPSLGSERRQELIDQLMAARRDVKAAKAKSDPEVERAARDRVHTAKVGLGERGKPWWEKPDGDR